MPELSKRKKEILKAVIDDFIVSATPISSQDIKDRHLPEISSATIRSELAALEEMGYLNQPHVSAGRVPSNDAYRLYANYLIQNKTLKKSDLKAIKEQFDDNMINVEDIIKRAAKIISDVTNYTSVVLLHDDDIIIRNIKLVELIENTALVIVITNKQVLKDSFITLPKDLPYGCIETVNAMLNQMFVGKNINELVDVEKAVDIEVESYRFIFEKVLQIIRSNIKKESIVTEGEYKILDYPDSSIGGVKKLMDVITRHENLNQIVKDEDNQGLSIKIGDGVDGSDEFAVVTTKYTIGGKEIGRAGVIGPVRMDYEKVCTVLNYVCKMIDKL